MCNSETEYLKRSGVKDINNPADELYSMAIAQARYMYDHDLIAINTYLQNRGYPPLEAL